MSSKPVLPAAMTDALDEWLLPFIQEMYFDTLRGAQLLLSECVEIDGREKYRVTPIDHSDPRITRLKTEFIPLMCKRLARIITNRMFHYIRHPEQFPPADATWANQDAIEMMAEQALALLDWAGACGVECNAEWAARMVHFNFRLYRHWLPEDVGGPLPPAEDIMGERLALRHMEGLRRRMVELRQERTVEAAEQSPAAFDPIPPAEAIKLARFEDETKPHDKLKAFATAYGVRMEQRGDPGKKKTTFYDRADVERAADLYHRAAKDGANGIDRTAAAIRRQKQQDDQPKPDPVKPKSAFRQRAARLGVAFDPSEQAEE